MESLIALLVLAVLVVLGMSAGVIRWEYRSGSTHVVLPAEGAK